MQKCLTSFMVAGLASMLLRPCSAPAAQDLVMVDIPFTKHVLKNGLTLIVHEDHKAPLVSVNIWYHVGSKNEKPGRTGFAHLFEHLMFNGSEHFNDDYFKLVEPEGATTLNGTTDFDRTNYFQDAPVSALDLILWAESDRMGYLLGAIDQAKLDEQRGVVLNEKRQGENQPYGKLVRLLFENIFPKGHPYSWDVIGSTEDLEAASLEDVKQWFKDYYGAANAVICLAGDIDPATAKAKVEKYFGSIPSGPAISRPEVWIPRFTGTRRFVTQDPAKLPALVQAWIMPHWTAEDSDRLSLVGDILSVGKTSRLYKRLVYEDQLAVEVQAFPYGLEIAGLFGVFAVARPGVELAAIEKAADEEVARFLKSGPTEEELERARNRQVASFIRGAERIGGFGGKSDILLRNQIYAGDPAFYKVSQKRIQTATAGELQEAARQWLSDGKLVIEVQPFPEYQVAEQTLDRNARPKVDPPPQAKLPSFERFTLDNGLNVMVMENHSIPVLLFQLSVDAGYAADPAELPGLASMTMNMIDEGTKNRTTLQISDELNILGAELGAGANLDQCEISLNTLKSTLEKSLDIYQDVLFNPSFPEKELDRLKKETIAGIEMEKSTPDTMGLRVLPKLLYGEGHAYGAPLTGTGTEESIEKMTVADLKKFYQNWIKPNNATLIIVGDTTVAEIRPLVKKHFGIMPRGEVPQKNLAKVKLQENPSVYILNKPNSEQSVIYAAHLAPPTANPEELAMSMVNTILGGKFTSRINMNLREGKHWTYGARSSLTPAKGQRPFMVHAPVQTDKTADSIKEILSEITAILGERPPTQDEIEETRKRSMLSLAGRWETMNGQLNALNALVWFGYPDDYWATYASRLSKLTSEDLSQASHTLLHPKRLTWLIVGDRSKIENEIKGLGLGSIHWIDADGNPVQ